VRRVLITGGAGFVGRHFVRHFLEAGDDVVVVDPIATATGGIDPSAGWPLFDPWEFTSFHFVPQDCREWFRAHPYEPFDLVLHLAAMVGGRLMIEHNPLAIADDLSIDAEYWQWATTAQPTKTICFSSSAAYPIKLQREEGFVLLSEEMIDFGDDIGMPDMSYGWAKLTCEYLARLAYERHGLASVCYRPFSGYGVDQDDSYPFPSICKRALAGSPTEPLIVWGSGRQMRDFVHIDDCVRGVITTMDAVDDAAAINLSTGVLTSFLEFAALAVRTCGYETAVHGRDDRPVGVFARGGDTTKQAELGFEAVISFADGIASAIELLREVPSADVGT
jgi:nucleoside-diphosphate-sugar epimerase